MAHVMHDEKERKQHSRRFNRSIRSGMSSLSSSHSSTLLEQMCASIIAPSGSEDARSWNEIMLLGEQSISMEKDSNGDEKP